MIKDRFKEWIDFKEQIFIWIIYIGNKIKNK